MPEIKEFAGHLIDLEGIPDGGVFIDAGMCEGRFTDEILQHVTNPHVFAIEPNRSNYRLMHEKYKRKQNVHIFQQALVGSKDPENIEFAEFDRMPEWGNVKRMYLKKKHEFYDVKTMSIIDLLKIIPYDCIDHLKMDIEGCEYDVVADLTKKHVNRIKQISMEIHNGLQYWEERLQEAEGYLKKIGYHTQFKEGELYATTRR